MIEVPRIVKKFGSSWVVLLDKETRKLLNIKEVGETIILRKEDKEYDSEEINSY